MHQPYILPTFLKTGIFSLEFLRENLTVEEYHILNFGKSLDMKFPWEAGPYVVKSRVDLPIIDNLLKSMGFSLGTTINYDPHSKRIQENNNKPFEHTKVAGLREAANWEDCPNKAPDNVSKE